MSKLLPFHWSLLQLMLVSMYVNVFILLPLYASPSHLSQTVAHPHKYPRQILTAHSGFHLQ